MKTLKTQWKKAVVLGALTLTSAVSFTNTAEAAPRQESRVQTNGWNNQRDNNRFDNNRFDNNRSKNTKGNNWDQGRGRFDQRPGYRRDDRNDHRFDYDRRDYRHDNDRDRGSDTGKIIGAGIVGAILGAVLSR